MRREEGDGIEFLESAAGDEVIFRGPGEEEQGKGIDVCVSYLENFYQSL